MSWPALRGPCFTKSSEAAGSGVALSELVYAALRNAASEGKRDILPGLAEQALSRTELGIMSGLLQHLYRNGLTREVENWRSSSRSSPVSSRRLGSAMGDDLVLQLSQVTELPIPPLLKLLAEELPNIARALAENGAQRDTITTASPKAAQ